MHFLNLYTIVSDLLHMRNKYGVIVNILLSIVGAVIGHFYNLFTLNQGSFNAVIWVISIDWVFGSALAFKNNVFETRINIKVVYYLVTYCLFLAACINIEKGFAVTWLTEAIMIPILVSTLLSAAKNASLLGFLPKGVFLAILKNIDEYKHSTVESFKETNNIDINE